ncbi:MAG TPA: dual specificity protein phosphatase family protein [Chloroflexota bacterium]|nr:dual specificity protein phosphatase family protein [Chloroflexota bacterium]
MHKFDFLYESAADERGLVRWYNLFGKLWLRGVARILEYSTRLHRKSLNLSRISDQLVVGGSVPVWAYPRLEAMGVTAVIDLREEAKDDEAALARLGIELLYLPATDRYAASQDQLRQGVEWAMERIASGGQIYAHCKHGVGRGPLMGLAILVAQGESSSSALRMLRSKRWQAAPNDRQLAALLEFETAWRGSRAPLDPSHEPSAAGTGQAAG